MTTDLQLHGKQAEYALQEVPISNGIGAILIGVSAKTQGEIHPIEGIHSIKFADGMINLFVTALSEKENGKKQQNRTQNDTDTQKLIQLAEQINEEDIEQIQEPISQQQTTTQNNTQQNHSKNQIDHFEQLIKAKPNIQQDTEVNINKNKSFEKDTQRSPNEIDDGNNIAAIEQNKQAASEIKITTEKQNLSKETDTKQNKIDTTKINPIDIRGTNGPDVLIGTNKPNIIDGLRNERFEAGSFFEHLIGGPSSDIIFYRGFWGEVNNNQEILALIQAGSGNDTIHLHLDSKTNVSFNGDAGKNTLVLNVEPDQTSPWDPNYILWDWIQNDNSTPTFFGTYLHPKLNTAAITEIEANTDNIRSGAGNKLNIIRPTSLDEAEIVGTNRDDWILASHHTKIIDAGNGNDFIIAKEGVVVKPGQGIDTIYSESNNYILSYEDSPYGIRVNLQNKTGLIFDNDLEIYSIDRLINAPTNIIGSQHNDFLVGDINNNTFYSTPGNDVYLGGGGNNSFIIQTTSGTIDIQDFAIDTDKLIFDLDHINSNGNNHYTSIVVDGLDNEVFSFRNNSLEEESILRLKITENGWINQINEDAAQEFIFIGAVENIFDISLSVVDQLTF